MTPDCPTSVASCSSSRRFICMRCTIRSIACRWVATRSPITPQGYQGCIVRERVLASKATYLSDDLVDIKEAEVRADVGAALTFVGDALRQAGLISCYAASGDASQLHQTVDQLLELATEKSMPTDCAESLAEVFAQHQHQLSQPLSKQEMAELVDFLKTL